MSFLAPLYFLGALAVAGPIIFHLIRRQPKGEIEFSSLMFLDSTPPRLTRRSRLENWPLFLLRCAAILALAIAFARPFLPLAESESVQGVNQAVILLIDQSASMKRAGLWDQATKQANESIAAMDDETLVSVISFDSAPRTILSLEESMTLDAKSRKSAAKEAIDRLSPGWESTDTGKAIRYAADQAALLEIGDAGSSTSSEVGETTKASLETRIVLLSDLQSGAQIETLQGYQWPDQVWLDVANLVPTTRGNVSLRVLPQTVSYDQDDVNRGDSGDEIRVQVSQADDGVTSTFSLRFENESDDAAVIQVPPGQTRFFQVKLPDQPNETSTALRSATLKISGDNDPFDNSFHFIRPRRTRQEVRFIQSQITKNATVSDVRDTLSFYVKQLPWSDSSREVQLTIVGDNTVWDNLDPLNTPLVIAQSSAIGASAVQPLQRFLASGGRVLVVLDSAPDESSVQSIAQIFDSPQMTIDEVEQNQDALISSVDFQSALITPLSEPGVNDFSNIRVWKHRRISGLGEDVQVILKLDDGSALLAGRDVVSETAGGTRAIGKLWILSAGWQPEQSQFALSTKFVPIMMGMLGPNRQLAPESLLVGDSLQSGDRATEPGFVSLDTGESIAVNLRPIESETASMDLDRMAQYGAVLSSVIAKEQELTAKRALRDIELEERQGWWQWLILATLGFIAAETFLAAKDRSVMQVEPS